MPPNTEKKHELKRDKSELQREVGFFGAVMMGMGAIIGTGVFVSIGIAAGVTGPSVILAIAVAGLVATFNGLSSAQLAANHPISGGTYEYGYRWLHPSLGFTAGWMFLCAKSASAATAALGFSGYAVKLLDTSEVARIPIAVGTVLVVTLLVQTGIRQSNRTNMIVVSVTLLSLLCFILAGIPSAWRNAGAHLSPFFHPSASHSPGSGFLEACALMFVAFTGYGRIATLGEEVVEPRKTIPRAIIATLAVSATLYMAVGFVGVAAGGASLMAAATLKQAAPLEVIAQNFELPIISVVTAVGAMTAMLGVLLNLVLGLSRVLLAMGRRGDMPRSFAAVNDSTATPTVGVLVVGTVISMLTLIGNVKTTWSFSAMTVLVYYALTNLAATRLNSDERLYPKYIPWFGLISCLSLALWVEPSIWGVGIAFIVGGFAFQYTFRRLLSGAGKGRSSGG